jgi:hypothetical protein
MRVKANPGRKPVSLGCIPVSLCCSQSTWTYSDKATLVSHELSLLSCWN